MAKSILQKMTCSALVLSSLVLFSVQTHASPPQAGQDTATPEAVVTTPPSSSAATPSSSLVPQLPDFTKVVEKTEDGVVNIRTMETITNRDAFGRSNPFGFEDDPDADEFFRFFFGPDAFGDMSPRMQPWGNQHSQRNQQGNGRKSERTVPSGVGSGFIISDDGYIITNNHVIDGASKIIVTLTNGKEYNAKVIGSDERTDVALIKIDGAKEKFKPLEIGNASVLKKGQWVLAIGSPFGLDSTVTAGIVSAINRDTGDYLPFIQTDVAVNPGNSGGPLINLQGQVVGVNSQIISRSGGFMGISLSIPIDEAMKVVDQLKTKGHVSRGRIGVVISELKDDVAKGLGLNDAKGALVGGVEPNGPAAKAGIVEGDVILKFNGKTIEKWSDLPRMVGQTEPGSDVVVTVYRRGKTIDIKMQLEDVNKGKATAKNDNAPQEEATRDKDRLGLMVAPLTNNFRQSKELSDKITGVVITSAEGLGADAGLRKDDIILVVDNQDITTVKQYQEVVKGLPKNKLIVLLIRRDDLTQWVPIKLED